MPGSGRGFSRVRRKDRPSWSSLTPTALSAPISGGSCSLGRIACVSAGFPWRSCVRTAWAWRRHSLCGASAAGHGSERESLRLPDAAGRNAPCIPDPARAGSGHSGEYRLVAPGFWGYADDTVPERNGDARTLLAAEPPAVAHGLSDRAGSKKNRNAMKTTAAEPDHAARDVSSTRAADQCCAGMTTPARASFEANLELAVFMAAIAALACASSAGIAFFVCAASAITFAAAA